MIRVVVLASGSGSNAENLVNYFADNQQVSIHRIYTNNPKAGVIERAKKLNVTCEIISKTSLTDTNGFLKQLTEEKIDFIVLAGFLLLIPPNIIDAYKGRIINVHPALLPMHGGKGFYGNNVHQSVIASGAIMSGITIHHVNEKFDEGEIIFQAACHVSQSDTPETLAQKIHTLEYSYFPVVVEKTIRNFSQQKI